MLSQFTPDHPGQTTLAGFGFPPGVYPIGRLDADSEGLLLLSDESRWTSLLLDPSRGHPRTYLVQVEGLIDAAALQSLARGVVFGGRRSRPAVAEAVTPEPDLPPRHPPVRFRRNIPTSWLRLTLTEGRNRQVRRMTAATGFPTLRLLRVAIGRFALPENLGPGRWRALDPAECRLVLQGSLRDLVPPE